MTKCGTVDPNQIQIPYYALISSFDFCAQLLQISAQFKDTKNLRNSASLLSLTAQVVLLFTCVYSTFSEVYFLALGFGAEALVTAEYYDILPNLFAAANIFISIANKASIKISIDA
jgi:hypothetical protein